MNDCPSCKSPDTIPYPWDDENDRFGVLREFYPEHHLCVGCGASWEPSFERLRATMSKIPRAGSPIWIPVTWNAQ